MAPMMDWTDRHCRVFHRLLAPHARLYTEMVASGALIHGDVDRHLRFDPAEKPLALQLGGSEPADLAAAASIGADYGYDEINLNCGCPSDRVQKGRFGACLMAEPDLVAACVSAMQEEVSIPVTVKCRIGIDDSPGYAFLEHFVTTVAAAGCRTFIVHARKAWLKGLSPKENREVPPLDYDLAARLKQEHPSLSIHLNGGLTTLVQVETELARFDGVMIGREAYHRPWFLAELDHLLYGTPLPRRADIARAMIPYIDQVQREGGTLHAVTRHMLGLYAGCRGAKSWRRLLGGEALLNGDAVMLIEKALETVRDESETPCAA